MKQTPVTRLVLIAALAFSVMALLPTGAEAKKLEEAEVFMEINDTDGDAGIQVFLDGVGWRRMKVFAPGGRKVLDVAARGGVRTQGITEFFLESAEPSFDEQPLDEFLALFPEGEYRFVGRTKDGRPLNGKTEFTHAIPGAPVLVLPVEDDDAVDPNNTVIEWQAVADPPGSEIVEYIVVVETEEPELRVFEVNVGPEVTSVSVPPEFMNGGGPEYKYEVLAVEESGNKTISEREFEIAVD